MKHILETLGIIIKSSKVLSGLTGNILNLLNETDSDSVLKDFRELVDFSIRNPKILKTTLNVDEGIYTLAKGGESYTLFHVIVSNEPILRKVDQKDYKKIEAGWKTALTLVESLINNNDVRVISDVFFIKDQIGYYPLRAPSKGNTVLNSIAAIGYWYSATTGRDGDAEFRIKLEKKVFNNIISIIEQLRDSGVSNENLKRLVLDPTGYVWADDDDSSTHLLGFILRTGYENYVLQIINTLDIKMNQIPNNRDFIDSLAKSYGTTPYSESNRKIIEKVSQSGVSKEDKGFVIENLLLGTPVQIQKELNRLKSTYRDPAELNMIWEKKFKNGWVPKYGNERFLFKALENVYTSAGHKLFYKFTDMWRAGEQKNFYNRIMELDYNTLMSIVRDLDSDRGVDIDRDSYEQYRSKFIDFLEMILK